MAKTLNYRVTNCIEDATHWIAREDNRSCVKEHIIPGKIYQFIEGDLILSEDGCFSSYWMAHKGDLIIMKGNIN